MPENVARPVFIFLPVRENEPAEGGHAVDPVCGRVLADGMSAGRLSHNGRHHYFCSLDCAQQFASDPAEFDLR